MKSSCTSLSRVSEEKEESLQRLKDEQGNFECKIQKLEQQKLVIGRERESILQDDSKEDLLYLPYCF